VDKSNAAPQQYQAQPTGRSPVAHSPFFFSPAGEGGTFPSLTGGGLTICTAAERAGVLAMTPALALIAVRGQGYHGTGEQGGEGGGWMGSREWGRWVVDGCEGGARGESTRGGVG
jgi:hypothetical protein